MGDGQVYILRYVAWPLGLFLSSESYEELTVINKYCLQWSVESVLHATKLSTLKSFQGKSTKSKTTDTKPLETVPKSQDGTDNPTLEVSDLKLS